MIIYKCDKCNAEISYYEKFEVMVKMPQMINYDTDYELHLCEKCINKIIPKSLIGYEVR